MIYFIDKEKTKGYKILNISNTYNIVFFEKTGVKSERISTVYSRGRQHSYLSEDIAKKVLSKDILSLYKAA